MFLQNHSSTNGFHKILFCGSLGISLSTDKDVGRGKVAYIWISPNPAKAEHILGGVAIFFFYYYYTHIMSFSNRLLVKAWIH